MQGSGGAVLGEPGLALAVGLQLTRRDAAALACACRGAAAALRGALASAHAPHLFAPSLAIVASGSHKLLRLDVAHGGAPYEHTPDGSHLIRALPARPARKRRRGLGARPPARRGGWLTGVAADPGGRRVYVCDYQRGVLRFAAPGLRPLGALVPARRLRHGEPEGLAVHGGHVFVASVAGACVTAFPLRGDEEEPAAPAWTVALMGRTPAEGPVPWGMCVWPGGAGGSEAADAAAASAGAAGGAVAGTGEGEGAGAAAVAAAVADAGAGLFLAIDVPYVTSNYAAPPADTTGSVYAIALLPGGRAGRHGGYSRVALKRPCGLCFDHAGHLWVTCMAGRLVRLAGPRAARPGAALQALDVGTLLPAGAPAAAPQLPFDMQAVLEPADRLAAAAAPGSEPAWAGCLLVVTLHAGPRSLGTLALVHVADRGGGACTPTREELRREVASVLSLHGGAPTKVAPGTPRTPSQAATDEPLPTINGSSDAALVAGKDSAMPDARVRQQLGADNSVASSVGRLWVADAAGGAGADDWGRSMRMRLAIKSFRQVVRAHPYILVVALLTTAVLATAGVLGVLAAARTEMRHRRDSAMGFANNAAVAFTVQLQQTFAPLTALTTIIHFQPDFTKLAPRFDALAAELLSALPVPGSVASLQLTPNGVVSTFYPLKGNEQALNHNLLKDPKRRVAALETIQRRNLTMQGPITLLQGWRGAVARVPVFISNVSESVTFGAPNPPYDCPPGLCYDAATRTRWWGFVSCIVRLDDLANGRDARLRGLTEMEYDYEFTAPQPDTREPIVIARSPDLPFDPVSATVFVPNGEWSLRVAPQGGWVPAWRGPMLATVVVISCLVGLLVLATLVSRRVQLWLLREMKLSNRALASEKERTDVLLARQYNLISLMAQQGALSGRGGGGSLQEKTLDQIESMRRSIGAAATFSESGDQLQLLELLGEGTFGKVYKGVWRGSTVAIKTMILPAKMSGAEKRERMAIMEAAISSSMCHPNIVQTYTYTIKPATSAAATSVRSVGPASPARPPAGEPPPGGSESASQGFDVAGDSAAVHSFEVNIAMEFCDWGCLRDALDCGAFYTRDCTVNYAAILDTAADVAKAMLHLHCNQVIHSDLKVRNVLLKSDGSSERGCVAKVADFGLAVRMENADTHVSAFQGTMSHMAPECMLRGHISKAADVYSFGITLWELYTGGHAFHGIPRALLGHQVAVCGLRPAFPDFTPGEFRSLAERCWATEPDKRPSFEEILATLQRMRARQGGRTAPMPRVTPRSHLMAQREADELAAAERGAGATGGDSTGQMAARVGAAEAAGLVQLASFYPQQQHQQHGAGAADQQNGGRQRAPQQLPPISDAGELEEGGGAGGGGGGDIEAPADAGAGGPAARAAS
ncbi:serine/threonine-protein kinase [Scenedesmus sp. PABB004]|nr:serine/threonine-protein kinase [Scenedesmus sp. PABB004]